MHYSVAQISIVIVMFAMLSHTQMSTCVTNPMIFPLCPTKFSRCELNRQFSLSRQKIVRIESLPSVSLIFVVTRPKSLFLSQKAQMSLCMTKPAIWVSDQVQHKPACTVTEETQNLENLGISRGGNVLSV